MNALLTPLVESPELVMYVEELQELLAAERVKREKFYEDISPEDKWEFINGEVIMHSPATLKHTEVNGRILRLVQTYVDVHRLGKVLFEKTLVSFSRNDYEPDTLFFPKPVADQFEPTQWKFPVPAFIVEVLSPSTEKRDRGIKLKDYALHGVAEYWIVDPVTERIEQYLLAGRVFELRKKHRDGAIAGKAVAGFVMPVRAAFEDEANLQALWALQPKQP